MTWVVVILLALGCFALFALLFRLPSKAWPLVLAVLAFGLAGYGLQASPGYPGAPKAAIDEQGQEGWRIVELRQQIVGDAGRSQDPKLITADALVRHGQYENAANLLRAAVEHNPGDSEAWLAMANALTFQAEGNLTPAALLAYRRAAEAAPGSAGPSFFVGLALIRQGDLIDGRELWAQQLASMPKDAPGRDILAARLAALDELIQKIAGRMADEKR